MLEFLPPGVGPLTAAILVVTCFVGGIIPVLFGLGGGTLIMIAFGLMLPPLAVIPAHAVVTAASNISRTWLLRKNIFTPVVLPFFLGSVLGVALVAPLAKDTPGEVFLILLGIFIIWTTWTPHLKIGRISNRGFSLVGFGTTAAGMFVGVTAPVVAAFLDADKLGRHRTVGTHAVLMMVNHSLRTIGFVAVGFAYSEWLLFLLVLVVAVTSGTRVGRMLLDRFNDRSFARVFKWFITAMALALMARAIHVALGG